MIRTACRDEILRLQQLWLHAAASAHPSLPRDYWQKRAAAFRQHCRGADLCLVFRAADGEPADAFVSVSDGDWLRFLCVSPLVAGRGVGSRLLRAAARGRPQLQVAVLEENLGGRYFLQQHGFVEVERRASAEAGQAELHMCSGAVCMPLDTYN